MKLSQSVTYAVHASLLLTENQKEAPISCGCLAASGKMPERFLLQILRDLAKQGILHSSRGGGGGFMLERHPDEISLLDVIEAIDGPLTSGLPKNVHFPDDSGELLRQTLARVAEATRNQLSSVKLTGLLGSPTIATDAPESIENVVPKPLGFKTGQGEAAPAATTPGQIPVIADMPTTPDNSVAVM